MGIPFVRHSRHFTVLFLLILIAAAIPRSIELINNNYLFGFDQGLYFQEARKIVFDHNFTLIGPEVGRGGGFFQGPGWIYLLAIPMALSNGDPYQAMVLMVMMGLAAVALSMVAAKRMFGATTGLLIGFFFAISPALIAQSRFIWAPFPITLFMPLFIYSTYRVLQKKAYYFLLHTALIGVFSHFEIAVAGIMLIQTILLVPWLLYKKFISFRVLILSGISFIATQLSLILFDIRNGFLITQGVIRLWTTSHEEIGVTWQEKITTNADVFIRNFISTFPDGKVLGPPLMLFIIACSIVYITDRNVPYERKLLAGYFMLSPVILFIILTVFPMLIAEWWLICLMAQYCFLMGILTAYMAGKKGTISLAILTGVLLISFIGDTKSLYAHDFYDYGGTHKIKGKLEAIDYIYNDAKGEPFGVLVFTPPVYTYDYEYLFWWHGSRKYGYVPHQEKKGVFYLLINPDNQKPWSYNGWRETVVKTGTSISSSKLPSGFIVEKRHE